MKRKLYFCERCQRVYTAEVNNGVCREIVSVGTRIFGPDAGRAVAVTCDGTIRPIDYKPPTKDPLQRDIEDAENAFWNVNEKTWRTLYQNSPPPYDPPKPPPPPRKIEDQIDAVRDGFRKSFL